MEYCIQFSAMPFFERQPQKRISPKNRDQDCQKPRNEILLGKLGEGQRGLERGSEGMKGRRELPHRVHCHRI